jgi:hypothetical protein
MNSTPNPTVACIIFLIILGQHPDCTERYSKRVAQEEFV